MTFDIPDDVAERFSSEVSVDEQSRVVLRAMRRRIMPKLTEEQWDALCEAANNDPETQEIEREMAALPDTMTEEWNDPIELPKAG